MQTWTTFYGKEIEVASLSHQHLSNIHYYFNIVLNQIVPDFISQEIDNRFGGILLPYHPLISFNYEIKSLVDDGYTSGEINADIIVNGKWIGKILYN